MVDTAHNSFVKTMSVASQTVAGVGISGRAFFMYGANTSGNNGTYTDQLMCMMGVAETMTTSNTVIAQRTLSTVSEDNVGTSVTSRSIRQSGAAMYLASSGQTITVAGTLTSVGGDGFNINWTTNAAFTTLNKNTSGYIAVDTFGGPDIVNAKTGHFQALSGHGSQTHSGVGFSGNFLLLLPNNKTGVDNTNGATVCSIGIGMAASSTQEVAAMTLAEEASANADTWRWQRNDRVYLGINTAGAAVTQAEFTGFTSDGFSLNWISGATAAVQVPYLVMKISGNVKVGTFNMMSGTGNISTSGVGFSGKHLILFSYGTTSNQNISVTSAHARLSIGSAKSSTQRSCMFIGDEDGPTTMANIRTYSDSRCLLIADENATATSSTTQLECDFVGFHADGFTLNRVTNTFTGEFSGITIGYAVIGDAIAAAEPPLVTEEIIARGFGAERVLLGRSRGRGGAGRPFFG